VSTPRAPAAGKLRVLVVNWLDRENPQAGGAEIHLHEIFGRMAGKGHTVSALVSGWRGCEPRVMLDGIDVHRSGGRYTFSLTAPTYYRRRLKGGGFDVVVEDLNKVPLFSPLWAGVPVVLLTHHLFGATAFQAGPPPLAAATWLLERPLPAVYRGTPTIAVSESTRADLERRGIRPELIEVIPNGIDLRHYSPGRAGRSARPTLLYLGRLKRYKRIDLGLEATAILARQGLDVEVLVAGDGEAAGSLRAKARALGIEERARFLGFVSEEQKLELLRRAWVHVQTSPKEGWGISNLEAAACGTPSVVSDSPGLRESVVHGETGLVVRHGDVGALAAALHRLLRDRELRERMGRQAVAFAGRFTWEASAEATEAALLRVVADRHPH